MDEADAGGEVAKRRSEVNVERGAKLGFHEKGCYGEDKREATVESGGEEVSRHGDTPTKVWLGEEKGHGQEMSQAVVHGGLHVPPSEELIYAEERSESIVQNGGWL